MMADNLAYVLALEHSRTNSGQGEPRGKVFAFAHNSHLKCGPAQWQLGPDLLTWWPAGAHLTQTLGPRYAVIATGVGVSEPNGISHPEPGTLEARLAAAPGPIRFIPTREGNGLAPAAVTALPTRSASTRNPTYFAFTRQSLTDFDALAVLNSIAYNRGGPALR
jgi:hypothetical protein